MSVLKSSTNKQRIFWVDAAKAVGIYLVFHGHFVEKLFRAGSETGFTHMKFIYAFHMPFFFFMAGFFFRRRYESGWKEIWVLFQKRIFPVLLFAGISLLVWPIYLQLKFGMINWGLIVERVNQYWVGYPGLNEVTWFLVCLFTAELFALLFLNKTKRGFLALLIAIVFLRFGLLMTENMQEAEVSLGVAKNFWYFHEAFVAFGLYALGYAIYPQVKILLRLPTLNRIVLFLLFTTFVVFTFDANTPYDTFFVVMQRSWHGFNELFVFTALSGIFAVLLLASFIPRHPWIEYVGQNTIVMIGTNGLFLHFVYRHLADVVNRSEAWWYVLSISVIVSLASIAASVPLIWFLNRYLPGWVGNARV